MARKSSDASLKGQGGLYGAVRLLTSELSLETVLQKVADLSRELAGASYAALGVLGDDGELGQLVTSGISVEERKRIGALPKGRGVLGAVLREGRALRLANIAEHRASVGFPPHHPEMKSFLGVPIELRGRVIGSLYLANKIGAKEFSQEDETVVILFGAQAAVAIENARLFEEERRRWAQLDLLNRIGRELSRIFELDQLLQTVAELVQQGFGYENVGILWVDQAQGVIVLRALAGVGKGVTPLNASWPLDQGLTGWAVRNKQSVLSNQVAGDPRYLALPGLNTSSELAVPVLVKGEVTAIINVENREPNVFHDSDVKTFETLADQLAVAIENIQLHRQHEGQLQRLAVADERERIARDLHDGTIQSIYAVGLQLEDLGEQVGRDPAIAPQGIATAVEDLNQIIRDIRSYIMDLRPRELQGRRLDQALQSLTEYLEERTGVAISIAVDLELDALSERLVVNLWHILQEAFSNIEKYANAKHVDLSLALSDGALELRIADDGVGFDVERAEAGKGYGLSNIKDRAERLGGVFIITSAPGKGTQLNVRIPIKE